MVPHSSKCEVPLLGAQCESEEQSDVVFVVCGAGGERWRVPAHRRVLAAASPVFAAMLHGPLAEAEGPGREVQLHDVEPRAFDLLLRHVYGKTVKLQSVDTALATLYAAHKYHCEALELHCLDFLYRNINDSSALVILHCIRVYYSLLVTPAPSAPSLEILESAEEAECSIKPSSCQLKDNLAQNSSKSDLGDSASNTQNVKLKLESTLCDPKVPSESEKNQSKISVCDNRRYYKLLLQKCLQFIDLNADKVLQQEVLDEISKEELLFIVQRDTLFLSSEVVLFKALEQWSKCVCKRNCWELTPNNCRKALGNELLFSVRYLLMTSEEFMNSPMTSKLLSTEECNYFLGHILKHTVIPGSVMLQELLPSLKKKRCKPTSEHAASSHCSDSYKELVSLSVPQKTSQVSLKQKKLFKKKKDQCRKEEVRLQERKPNMSDYFFSCIACIFD